MSFFSKNHPLLNKSLGSAVWIAALLSPFCITPAFAKSGLGDASQPLQKTTASNFGALPLSFEANLGQTDSQVKFLSRGAGYTLYLTATEAVLTLMSQPEISSSGDSSATQGNGMPQGHASRTDVLRMQLIRSNSTAVTQGLEELPGAINYFIGRDQANWRTEVPAFARVKYEDIYPGTDLIYYGNQRQLEYDFVVSPGANPDVIRLRFEGAKRLEVDNNGDLVLHVGRSVVRFNKPVIFQESGRERQHIDGGYTLIADSEPEALNLVAFQIAAYDTSRPLIIDPLLVYSTYVGGSDLDSSLGTNDVAVDSDGNVIIVGSTKSLDFPTLNAVQSARLGFNEDAFVTKLNADGSGLVYSTYFGGSTQEGARNPSSTANSIVVDSADNAYVTGTTVTPDFPTTAGAFQPTYSYGGGDAFALKLSPTGTLVYSTFLGGNRADRGNDIAIDSVGSAYIVGQGNGQVPVTTGAFQEIYPGGNACFVTKLNPTGSAMEYSTHLGGTDFDAANGVAVDSFGNAVVAGVTLSTDFPTTAGAFQTTPGNPWNTFVTKLDSTGSSALYSTYLGGSGDFETLNDVAVDAAGNAYVTGSTNSADFPTTAGAYQENIVADPAGNTDAFATKLNASGTGLIYSTFIGDRNQESGHGLTLNSDESLFVTFNSNGFQLSYLTLVEPLPEFAALLPCNSDGALGWLDATGSTMLFSTLLGGCGNDLASDVVVDSAGNAYVTGAAGVSSNDFPTTLGAFQENSQGGGDAYVIKISFAPTLTCSGFEPPMDSGPVTVKKNRVLPLKAELLDASGIALTDFDITAPPVIQVLYDSGAGSAIDVTDDALPAGQGTEGNQFEFGTEYWQFNLKTKHYNAVGTYTINMLSGDVFEYKVDSCEATFIINP